MRWHYIIITLLECYPPSTTNIEIRLLSVLNRLGADTESETQETAEQHQG